MPFSNQSIGLLEHYSLDPAPMQVPMLPKENRGRGSNNKDTQQDKKLL